MNPDRASARLEPPAHVPVVVRVSARQGAQVGLLGEVGDWLSARAMREVEPGTYEARLDLPEGVYAYKVKVDGAWELDAANPRTRARAGARNNVLSVGGAPEPLLFAACAPWIVASDRGGLVVTAALRRGAGDSLSVAWRESGVETVTPMERHCEEDEHVVFRARISASAARCEVTLVLADGRRIGREDGAPFVHARPRAEEDLPAWWKSAVVYTIFVDRFRGGDDATWGDDPGPRATAGGTLEGIRRSLDELEDLGVNTLYLTPVHVGASCHRYDLVDPFDVDPALGGEEAFMRLGDAVHARKMRLIVDFSFSHAGRGFPPYEDVLEAGRASRYAAWFQWSGDKLKCYGKREDAPLFDLEHPDVRKMVLECAKQWADRGVDGLRLDSAAEVPFDLAREVRRVLRLARPDALVVGEVVPAHAWRFRAEAAVDAATDFGLHAALTDLFARRTIDPAEAVRRARVIELDRGGRPSAALRFLSTHDHPRFMTLARAHGHAARAPSALLFLMTWPGVPALLYGEEVGLSAATLDVEPEGAWADRMPMAWDPARRDETLRERVRAIVRARRASRALSEGELEVLHADAQLLVYRRSAGRDVVDVALNAGDAPAEIELTDADRPAMEPLATVGEVLLKPPRLTLGPGAGVALARHAGDTVASARRLRILEAPRARDLAMTSQALETPAPPTRIDFALSELCNIRCEHCITRAPEKTRSGAARSLTPYLLDRLRGAFAYARYFGFVHGGEPTVAPLFNETLAAIREERAGAPYVVHLLTNGVSLGARAAHRLALRGVSSISVSLDGAGPTSNDAVRVGSRFTQVTQNIRDVVAMRRATGVDLRLGISLVVMAQNVAELVRMIELAAQLGVDWLKLEELAPVTPFAKRSLVALDDPRWRYAVSRAVLRGKELGLVVVDHTRPREIWRCKLDAKTSEFLDADEYANRTEIHPCRVPWEHVCIEPNGDVKLGDFFGPVLGNIAGDSLEAIWNGSVAREMRRRAPSARLCESGPVVCLPSKDPSDEPVGTWRGVPPVYSAT